jgi:hypothetical protein
MLPVFGLLGKLIHFFLAGALTRGLKGTSDCKALSSVGFKIFFIFSLV